jgi:hypothetical protein
MTAVRVDIANKYGKESRFYQSVSSILTAMVVGSLTDHDVYPPGHDLHTSVTLVMLFEQREDDRGFDAARFQAAFDALFVSMPCRPYLMKPTPEFKAQVKLWRTDAKAQLAAASNGVFI